MFCVAHGPFVEEEEGQGVREDAGRNPVIQLKMVPVAVPGILSRPLATTQEAYEESVKDTPLPELLSRNPHSYLLPWVM